MKSTKSKSRAKALERFVKLGPKGARLSIRARTWHAVLDTTTNLIWSRTLGGDRVTQPDAVKAAAAYRLCGKEARLPTRAELLTLVDDTKHSPAIDTRFFPNCKSNWYWTSTPAAPSPGGCAWLVGFYDGNSNWDYQSYTGFVRAVRAGQ